MSRLVEELNINNDNRELKLSNLDEVLQDNSYLDEEDVFEDTDNEEFEVESLESPVLSDNSDIEIETQQGGSSPILEEIIIC